MLIQLTDYRFDLQKDTIVKMRIAFTYNVRHVKPSLESRQAIDEAEFDEPETIQGIAHALKKLGHQVFLVEADEKAYFKFKCLRSKVDLVFNIAEGISGSDREAQIPAILEILKIPYVGSKPLAQALCLNKAKTKEVLKYHKIPTPNFQLFTSEKEKLSLNLKFPLIAKPNAEGSSKGICQSSFVKDEKALKMEMKNIFQNLNQAVLVEEFLTGREFTVALIGNHPVETLPLVEINFSGIPKNLAPIDSYEVKWIIDNPNSAIETVICPAKIEKNLLKKIQEVCLKTKMVLDVLDWCRIDLRLNSSGIPNIIEVNQIPGIIPDLKENSRFPLAARVAGYNFGEMLQKIIDSACDRYGLKNS
ncbi:ATP-grasp domain-containing protein [Patescibacteria group bacterium]|nr:ATP-grasp domain-containing protein [Patescibacteria group bacterium]